MTPKERGVAAATVFNANRPGHFPGRPLFEGLVTRAVEEAVAAERGRCLGFVRWLLTKDEGDLFTAGCRIMTDIGSGVALADPLPLLPCGCAGDFAFTEYGGRRVCLKCGADVEGGAT